MSRYEAIAPRPEAPAPVSDPGTSRDRDTIRVARCSLPPAVMLAMALWRISGASFWRDEAATLSAVRRPMPVLLHMLGRTDVVHGLYYLLMWPVVRVLGTSELAVRLPSAVAVALAAAGIAALGARLVSERAGLAAGLTFAMLPVTSRFGQEARSYAVVMAVAVLATYLLVRAGSRAAGGRGWWLAYAAALALLGWLNVIALLLIPAHAVSLTGRGLAGRELAGTAPDGGSRGWRARLPVAWRAAVIGAVIAVSPLLALAYRQRHGTARFLATTTPASVTETLGRLTGSWPALIVVAPLVFVAVKHRADSPAARIGLSWLLLPPAVLIIAGTVTPLYDPRYVLFCVPALALLAGAGLDIVTARFGRRAQDRPLAALLAGVLVIAVFGLWTQLAERGPAGHGDNIRLAAQIVARYERPGDAVLYQPPWWRQVSAAYPYGFRQLRDLSLAKTPGQAGNFTGVQLTAGQIRDRLRAVSRVWLIEFQVFRHSRALSRGWTTVARWRAGTLVLVLYQRRR